MTEDVRSDIGDAFSCSASSATRAFRSGLLFVDERSAENRPLEMALSRSEPVRDAVSDVTLSGGGNGLLSFTGSLEFSCDRPGRPLRPDTKLSLDVPSSLLLLYAAFPIPLSAVCLNHAGSRDPNDAAIWSRDGSGSSAGVLLEVVPVSEDTIERGLLLVPLELGRCCQDRVPERARLDALGEGLDAEAEASDIVAGLCVDGVWDGALLPDPKPLKSGMSSDAGWDALVSIAVEGGGVIGGAEAFVAALVDVLTALNEAFSGLMDFARSVRRIVIHLASKRRKL